MAVKTCDIDEVVNKKHLDENNLRVVDLECAESRLSDRCGANQSYVIFACKHGFNFQHQNSIIPFFRYLEL